MATICPMKDSLRKTAVKSSISFRKKNIHLFREKVKHPNFEIQWYNSL